MQAFFEVSSPLESSSFANPGFARASLPSPTMDRLLRLPPFLLGAQAGLQPGDIADGFALTGAFLQRHVFDPLNRPLPPARVWLLDKLQDADRL